MKIITKLTLGLALAFLFSADVFAQQDVLKNAETAFTNKNYFDAIELYKKAYTKERKLETKSMILFQTAECYRMVGDFKQSETWYVKAISSKYSDPKAKLYLADAQKAQGKYDEAMVEYNNYKAEAPNDPRGAAGAKSCELAKGWMSKPTLYKIENMTLINTKDREYCPTFADKKYNKLYFTSSRPGGMNSSDFDATIGEYYTDIYETSVDKKGMWTTPVALPAPINSKYSEGLTSLTKKGDVLFFTRVVPEKNKVVFNQLYSAPKQGNNWGEPTKLPFCNDTNKFAAPAVSADGMTLLFSSDLPGGQGENDIWMVKFDKQENKWGAPINLGSEINTAGNDVFPFLHNDGTLYFSSDEHLGMGGLDIFKAESKGENKWGNVTNMGSPVNSPSDDFGIIFESAKERGYLSSNRDGSKGLDDIWSFVLPPLMFSMDGVTLDSKGEPIEGVTVKLTGSDGSSVETKTDAAGKYIFAENGQGDRYIKPNTTYTVSTQIDNNIKTKNAPEGFVNSAVTWTETTVGLKESTTFKGHNFKFVPIQKEIRFPEVLYDLGQSTLRPESQDSLLFLYQTLVANPTFVIELSAHTDSRGGDAENLKLSDERAKACFDFLVAKGIPAARMVPKGYGKKRLLITDKEINKMKTPEEKEAAHQKNRRTVFTVLRKDFVDPNAPKEAPKAAPVKTDDAE